MNPKAESNVIEFQGWLNQSIRRAWILAFAVAIPGAFLLTLWFPNSPEALAGVAILGVAIGVISDTVERARKRRLQEIEQITAAVREAVQEVTHLIEKKVSEEIAVGRVGASLTEQQAEVEAIVERALSTNPLIIEELKSIHAMLAAMRKDLAALRPDPFMRWGGL